MNSLVKINIAEQDPLSFMETVRLVTRKFYRQKYCTRFLPINRASPPERRIDCYLFDVTLSQTELIKYFETAFGLICEVEMHSNISLDWQLIRVAGEATEILLNECPPNQRDNKLLEWHVHYILNSLGHTRSSEMKTYRAWIDFLERA